MHASFVRKSRCLRFVAGILILLTPALLTGQDNKKKVSVPAKVAPAKPAARSKTPGRGPTHTGPATGRPAANNRPTANGPNTSTARPNTTGRVTTPRTQPTTLKNGSALQKRANGKPSNIHNAQRNMDIHHSLNGTTRVSKTLPNGSKVVATRGGPSYVQKTYTHNGRTYASRTYVYNGRVYNRYYAVYPYRGVYLNVYAPGFYFAPGFYGWAYAPWGMPVYYSWGWGAYPWFGYYGFYFAPAPFYPTPSLWLTDYMISSDLSAGYQEQQAAPQDAPADQPAASATPALTPQVKDMIAVEVKSQIDLEKQEAAQNTQNQDPDPNTSGIAQLLSDGKTHIFVAGSPLDVVDSSGAECALSEGDVLNMVAPAAPDATAVNLTVLSSKGGRECPKSATVTVALTDLQDMQNHMREAIDKGMEELKAKQGQGGIPAAPAAALAAGTNADVAKNAPAPDPDAAKEVNQELADSTQAEKEVVAQAQQETTAASSAPADSSAPATPVTVSAGQTIDQVTASLGSPLTIIDLGSKKIYKYQDMKVTFIDGKVSDIE